MNEVCLFDGMRVSVGNTEFRMSFNYSLSYPEIDEKQQTTAHDHSYIELHIDRKACSTSRRTRIISSKRTNY